MKAFNKRWTVLDYTLLFFLSLLGFICLYPFYQVLITSFNNPQDSLVNGTPLLWIREFSLSNYEYFFANNDFMHSLWISVARTVIGALSGTLFTALFAYGLSKSYLIGKKLWTTLMIIPMYVSGGIIPTFIMIRDIGLYKHFLVFILPLLFSSYNSIIIMTFFKGISPSLEESARIDGANDLTIFFRIIIPVSMPVLATIILFNAVGHWNAWFDSMLYGGKDLVTLQAKLVEIIRDASSAREIEQAMQMGANLAAATKPTITSIKATAMAVTAIPIIMVYPFLQKYFVKGIMIGSVKG